MSKPVVCSIPDGFLACGAATSTRFSYSREYVPRALPNIPRYRVDLFQKLIGQIVQQFEMAVKFEDELKAVIEKLGSAGGTNPGNVLGSADFIEAFQVAKSLQGSLSPDPNDVAKLFGLLANTQIREVLSLSSAFSAAFSATGHFGIAVPGSWSAALQLPSSTPDDAKMLFDLFKSELGYLFYDRVRIEPNGFAVGEHVYSLSLAPGEEVTLEQKSWTKRDFSLEELLETEKSVDLELSSTVTTELQDSLDEAKKLEAGLNGTVGGGFDPTGLLMSALGASTGAGNASGSSAGTPGVNASVQPNIKAADELTQKESVKKTLTLTSKVAAKYRSLHRTTFKISTETYTESSSKRVIRNPNRTTPINLHYFKILRAERLTQERYAVRLCWAPWIKDPGADVRDRLAASEQADSGVNGTSSSPPQPPAQRQWKMSEWSEAADIGDHFDAAGGLTYTNGELVNQGGGLPASSGITSDIPDAWDWDGDQDKVEVRLNFPGQRDHHIDKVDTATRYHNVGPFSDPTQSKYQVLQKVHVGIDCTRKTTAGQLAYTAHGKCSSNEDVYRNQTSVQMRIGLNPVPTPEEIQAQQAYQQSQTAGGASGQAAATPDPSSVTYSPISELMRRLVQDDFTTDTYDDYWEVGYWHEIFEWQDASYLLYPGWWRTDTLPLPNLPGTDFLNASWARLFIPVRPGYEHSALRWIVAYSVDTPLSGYWEQEITKIKAEIEKYRLDNFGDPLEQPVHPDPSDCKISSQVKVLGCWDEMLPTDGTHLEVVQSATSAADDITTRDIAIAQQLQQSIADNQTQSVEIKKKAAPLISGTPTVDVTVTTDPGS